jgi:hypothetical protein
MKETIPDPMNPHKKTSAPILYPFIIGKDIASICRSLKKKYKKTEAQNDVH